MPPRPSSASKIKIGLIGTINRDTIIRADGIQINSWGGVLYNLKYLSSDKHFVIYPVINIGGDCVREITRILSSMPGVGIDFINVVQEHNNHCHLTYSDFSRKSEILTGGVPPLKYSQAKPLLDSDLILVNFISGRDIRLRELERLRENYKGLIYIDLHSLILGRRKTGRGVRRYMRRPREWERYAACADILQLNSSEFELLAGRKADKKTVTDFYRRHMTGSQLLVITLGQKGCLLVSGKHRIRARLIESFAVRKVFDTTGCGDIFAAGFIREYLVSSDSVLAAEHGNRLAADRCRQSKKIF